MRQVQVFNGKMFAGILTEETPDSYVFHYHRDYLADPNAPAISLTLPKTETEYRSPYLFPFFTNMLSEGHNRSYQSRLYKIDESDDFGLLMKTATVDTPGAITVKPL